MFSSLTTKIALKKAGLPSNALDFNSWTGGADEPRKPSRSNTGRRDDFDDDADNAWPAWMSIKSVSVPMTMQSWLSPPPPPVPVAKGCPGIGDMAPVDRDRKLRFGGGRPTLLVFMRCVGCAFAQKTFLALRAISVKNQIRCVAVSHSSPAATRKWLDLLGGEWSVEVVIDEDRAIYAAWGLGLCSVWQVFNPSSQAQAWKETGWLGEKVAASVQKEEERAASVTAAREAREEAREGGGRWKLGRSRTGSADKITRSATAGSTASRGSAASAPADEMGPSSGLGNKWQTAGAFAIDGRGTVIWGGQAAKVDDLLDLEAGVKILRA